MNPELLHRSLEREIDLSFSRSQGSGGQNVNKVSTRVTVSVFVDALEGITDDEKLLLKTKLAGRINSEGILSLSVQDTRSQLQNRILAFERLRSLITAALHRQKKRLHTKPTKASRLRRLEGKKHRGRTKSGRGTPRWDDE